MKIYKYSTIIMIPICLFTIYGAYTLNSYAYSFLSNLLLSIFASALLVFATSLIGYLLSKKALIELYSYEVRKIINIYKSAVKDYDAERDDNFGVAFNASAYWLIKNYDLSILVNIVRDYSTICPFNKTKVIINIVYQEIYSYISNLPYDIDLQVMNNTSSSESLDLDKIEKLLKKLIKV